MILENLQKQCEKEQNNGSAAVFRKHRATSSTISVLKHLFHASRKIYYGRRVQRN